MTVLSAEEQTWKNGPVQIVTLVEAGSPAPLKHTVEMSTPLDRADLKTSELPGKVLVCEVREIMQMNNRVVLRGSYTLDKPASKSAA